MVKTIKPELTKRFDEEMIVLEKWNPKKPISAIYWEPEKERFYVKRFIIENPDKEEKFISDHENAYLEVVSTDYFPMVELEFTKLKGKDRRPNEEINIEEFISIKGIKALGNQLTTDKVKAITLLDPLPDEPDPEVEEIEEENEIDLNQSGTSFKEDSDSSEENQTKLFDDE